MVFVCFNLILGSCKFDNDNAGPSIITTTGDYEWTFDDLSGSPKPDATNTGPTTTLSNYTGPMTIIENNTIIENVIITGSLRIEADNVRLANFKIDANKAPYGISIEDGHKGIRIEDGEIYNMASAAILGMGFHAKRLNIHDSDGDGIKAQGSGGEVIVELCFIHKLGKGEGAHADGNQTRGGANIAFRYNNIYMPVPGSAEFPGAPYKSNAAFILQLEISNFIIEHNWLDGGNYTIYSHQGAYVRNNKFGRNYLYGITVDGPSAQWSGNVWQDTGLPCP
ncbi:MAG: hypothetical protein CVU04_05770 [Bacteroidetes bacterium HGW-Bacteroidetes-20]|nr:MAG: hypothetical protein CVU04_05770 [Bacteroidetes bacterium HGW-Bacteroidetes-20]